jgi:tetratricopeptide (TPR) repeat protein
LQAQLGQGDDDALVREVLAGYFALVDEVDWNDEDCAEVHDEVARLFGSSANPRLVELTARALANRAFTLYAAGTFHTGAWEDAIAACDEMIARFGERGVLELDDAVAAVLDNKAAVLMRLGRPEQQLAVYREVLTRYQDRPEQPLMKRVAKALWNMVGVLADLDRFTEALAVCDELISDHQEWRDIEFAVSMRPILVRSLSARWPFSAQGTYRKGVEAIGERLASLAEDVDLSMEPKGYFLSW